MKPTLYRVGDVADQIRGVTYRKQDASTSKRDGFLPVLRAGNIMDKGLTYDDLIYVPSSKISPKQLVRKDDIVIAASSGSIEVVGKAARALKDFQGGFGAFCKVLRPRRNVDPAYFYHFFKTPGYRRKISFLAAGANINNLRNGDLNSLEIPLPSLAEQKRIAGILDAADALRAKRRKSLDQLDSLFQSTFLDLFGDPSTNPKGWELASIGDFAEVKGGKRLPKGESYSPAPTPFRYIRVADMQPNTIATENLKYLRPDTQAKIDRYTVSAGDVIISIAGTIGVTAPVPQELDGVNLTENAAKIVLQSTEKLHPIYLSYVLQMPNAQFQIVGHTGQVTIGKLALFRIKKVVVPVPSIEKQRRFATIVESVERQKVRMRAHLAELDALFASLQSRAFNGEL